jgi:hypothetical protein
VSLAKRSLLESWVLEREEANRAVEEEITTEK